MNYMIYIDTIDSIHVMYHNGFLQYHIFHKKADLMDVYHFIQYSYPTNAYWYDQYNQFLQFFDEKEQHRNAEPYHMTNCYWGYQLRIPIVKQKNLVLWQICNLLDIATYHKLLVTSIWNASQYLTRKTNIGMLTI